LHDRQNIARVLDQSLFIVTCLMMVVASLSIAVSQISLGLAMALWTAWHVALRTRPQGLGLAASAGALAVWALGMVPLSTDPGQSLLYMRRFYLFAALWIGAAAATNERRRAILMVCLVAGAVAISTWGQWRILADTGRLFSRRLAEMSNAMTSGALLMMVLLVIGGALMQRGLGRRPRILLLVAALPILSGLLQTFTRSTWLGLGAGCLVILLMARPRLLPVAVTVILVAGTALLVVPEKVMPAKIAVRMVEGVSTSRRLDLWQGGWAMVKARPLTGVGDCDLLEIAPRYYVSELDIYHGHMHSNPVMLAVIWGVPGLALALVFILAQAVVLVRRHRRLRALGERAPPWAAAWCLGAIGVWVGISVAGLFEWYFGDAETSLMNLAIVGIALGYAPANEGEGEAHV